MSRTRRQRRFAGRDCFETFHLHFGNSSVINKHVESSEWLAGQKLKLSWASGI
jgi:hypothetical protein